jgi:hypothetical protein
MASINYLKGRKIYLTYNFRRFIPWSLGSMFLGWLWGIMAVRPCGGGGKKKEYRKVLGQNIAPSDLLSSTRCCLFFYCLSVLPSYFETIKGLGQSSQDPFASQNSSASNHTPIILLWGDISYSSDNSVLPWPEDRNKTWLSLKLLHPSQVVSPFF